MIKLKNPRDIWLVLAWSILIVINCIQLVVHKLVVEGDYPWVWVLILPFVSLIVGYVMIFFWLLPGFDFIKKYKKLWRILLFILHGLAYGFLYILLVFFIFEILTRPFSIKEYFGTVKSVVLSNFHNVSKNYIYCLAIYFAFEYFHSRSQILFEKSKVESELNQVKLETLKAKLQPHFLFNTLNSVVALIDENKKKAQHALIDLSDLLRYSMNMAPDKLIPLEEEIDLLKKYLSIEQARYEDQLKIEWDWKKAGREFYLPPMILQPIVENSMKHGFKNYEGILNIVIEIHEMKREILIKNNGVPLEDNIKYGTGLQIIQQRLKQHFGERADFKIFQKDQWIVNHLKIEQ